MPYAQELNQELGYYQCGDVHYTCIFPAGLEPDPVLVKEIRSFCPGFVPILQVRHYLQPVDEKAYYYIIGLWLPTPDPTREHNRLHGLDTPSNFPFSGGAIYQQRAWSDPAPNVLRNHGLIDIPLAFDRALVNWMRATYHDWMETPGTIKEKELAKMRAAEEANRKELDSLDDQTQYSLRQDRHIITKYIEEGKINPPDCEPDLFMDLSIPKDIPRIEVKTNAVPVDRVQSVGD